MRGRYKIPSSDQPTHARSTELQPEQVLFTAISYSAKQQPQNIIDRYLLLIVATPTLTIWKADSHIILLVGQAASFLSLKIPKSE